MEKGGGVVGVEGRVVGGRLPNDAVALVGGRGLEGPVAGEGGWADQFGLGGGAAMLEGGAEAIQSAVAKVKPSSVTVELGVELAVRSGKLVGLLVEGSGTGSLTVTLSWQGGRGGGG